MRDLDEIKTMIRSKIEKPFDLSVVAHDISHLDRVAGMAMRLSATEGGNAAIILAAAYLHDYHRIMEKRHGRHFSPDEVEPAVREVLLDLDFLDQDQHGRVCDAINFTERYRCAGDELESFNPGVESKIVRDADMLDALGAIGIARAFMFGGYLGEPLWVAGAGDDLNQKFIHGKSASVVHHFHEKLFHLESEMMTDAGKKIAHGRSDYMRDFISRLIADLS